MKKNNFMKTINYVFDDTGPAISWRWVVKDYRHLYNLKEELNESPCCI